MINMAINLLLDSNSKNPDNGWLIPGLATQSILVVQSLQFKPGTFDFESIEQYENILSLDKTIFRLNSIFEDFYLYGCQFGHEYIDKLEDIFIKKWDEYINTCQIMCEILVSSIKSMSMLCFMFGWLIKNEMPTSYIYLIKSIKLAFPYINNYCSSLNKIRGGKFKFVNENDINKLFLLYSSMVKSGKSIEFSLFSTLSKLILDDEYYQDQLDQVTYKRVESLHQNFIYNLPPVEYIDSNLYKKIEHTFSLLNNVNPIKYLNILSIIWFLYQVDDLTKYPQRPL